MIIFTKAHVPDHLAQLWLQHLRDFDRKYPACHFEVFAEHPEASMAEVMEMLKIDPELTIAEVFARTEFKP